MVKLASCVTDKNCVIMYYVLLGIIHCDFEDDLCEWAVSTDPDSSKGRAWQRKTAQNLTDEGYVGPVEGMN